MHFSCPSVSHRPDYYNIINSISWKFDGRPTCIRPLSDDIRICLNLFSDVSDRRVRRVIFMLEQEKKKSIESIYMRLIHPVRIGHNRRCASHFQHHQFRIIYSVDIFRVSGEHKNQLVKCHITDHESIFARSFRSCHMSRGEIQLRVFQKQNGDTLKNTTE